MTGEDSNFNFDPMRLLILNMIIFFFLLPALTVGQSEIGSWGDHLSYMHPGILSDRGDKLFCATATALFTVDLKDNTIERLSKINGLTEADIIAMEADPVSGKAIIGYTGGNIDLLMPQGIVNLDAVKRSAISPEKQINDIYINKNAAYLSASFGIVLIDLLKNEIRETFILGTAGKKVSVTQVAVNDKYIYAATAEGLKKAAVTLSNLNDYRSWQNVNGLWPAGAVNGINVLGNELVVRCGDSLFIGQDSSWKFLYSTDLHIATVKVSMGRLVICEKKAGTAARVVIVAADGTLEKTYQDAALIISPEEAILKENGIWIADSISGLLQSTGTGFNVIQPNSPYSEATGEMIYANNSLWVTSGTRSTAYENSFSRNGFFQFSEQAWRNFIPVHFPALDSLYDLVTITVSKKDQSLWLGSFGGGLLRFNGQDKPQVFKQQSGISPSVFHQEQYRVSGLAFDEEDHLWIANYGAAENLVLRKTDGSWRKFRPPFSLNGNAAGQLLIDDFNQKWMVSPEGNGLLVFNHGQSLDNTGDDQWKLYRAGKGNGNLPDNNVLTIAKDKSGFIWVGTMKGIGIIHCASQAFTASCEAIIPVVQQDNFAGYLFGNEQVQAIAVNAADQKWIGTKNGAWLISIDGEKTIQHFTEDNSRLVSNDVRKITVDPKTGDVFFATAKGICSFRGNAIEGREVNQPLIIYPNPVPPGYNGSIAIRGVVTNAIVKITELDGRLVYQTRALGSQAIWNGRDYRGRQVSSGVYLVIVSDESRQQKTTGKIVFISR